MDDRHLGDLVQGPDVVRKPSLHRRRDAEGLVNPAEDVVHEVQRHGVMQVLDLSR